MDDIKLPQDLSLNDEVPFVRVGCTYYKKIRKPDRNGFIITELKVWLKGEITLDYGKEYLKGIPHFDDFVMRPDNINYVPVYNDCYNLYSKFNHTPKEGDWTWTKRLLEHIFGEQYALGIRYMQILYLHPDRSTIILALVSTTRGTGKTTFCNWINDLFGANVITISSNDFLSSFNAHYATKNLIIIEETLLEKQISIEKLKALATSKWVSVNEKFATVYKIPFYGKVILTSNNEDKFAKVDQDEIRFFVRRLSYPKYVNHAIEGNLREEIPAFLYYLKSLPSVDWSVSRSGFTIDELKNESLEAVVNESKSGLCKDLEMHIADFFCNNPEVQEFDAAPQDIKKKFFTYNDRYELNYIRSVLKNEFKMKSMDVMKYNPFNDEFTNTTGRPYRFRRKDFSNK